MRDMSKFGRVVSKVSRKAIAIALAFAMSMPGAAYADEVGSGAPATGVETDANGEKQNYFVKPEEHYQDLVDEAKALGVPDAFIRHYLANDFEEGKISKIDEMTTVKNTVGVKGLVLKKINVAKLAQTKIDLGEYNFGNYKPGNMIYNFLASKKLKGTAYFYVENATEPFCSVKVKGSIDDPWGETKSYAVDVRKENFKKSEHLYFQFVPDEALDAEGKINPEANGKGSLYLESVFFTEGSTPVLSFDIDKEVNSVEEINGSKIHNTLGYGVMNVKVPDGYKSPVSGEELSDKTYELDYIKGRGNSTWLQSKKPYKIKLEQDEKLLGMAENKHWGLLANYFDYTLLRNRYTDYLANELGMKYTPNSVAVDVVMDGVFYGSYQLSETVRIDKNRVDIDKIKGKATTEPEITGGYLLEHMPSWLSGEKLPLVGTGETTLYVDKPEYDEDANEEGKKAQLDYIGNYLGTIDKAVSKVAYSEEDGEGNFSVGNVDDSEGNGEGNNEGEEDENIPDWREVLDEDSLIKYTLMQSFSLNGDAYSGSTYYYKPRNEKLYCGPVWDFDFVAWGAHSTHYENPEVSELVNYEDLYMEEEVGSEETSEESKVGTGLQGFGPANRAPWFMDLYSSDKEFKENVVKTWEKFSAILKESAKDGGILDQMAEETYMSALANYQVASSYLVDSVDYWSGSAIPMIGDDGNKYTLNYYNEVNRLKNFVNHRAGWVDENISEMDQFLGNLKIGGQKVQFYVDDELYLEYTVNEKGIIEEVVSDAPAKEGYEFKGWFYTDDEGEEHKFNPYDMQIDYCDDEDGTGEFRGRTYYAKYKAISDIIEVDSFKFVRDTVYVSMFKDESEEGYAVGNVEADLNAPSYENKIIDLLGLIKIIPFDADLDEIEFCEVDKNGKEIQTDVEFNNDDESANVDYGSTCGFVETTGTLNLSNVGEIYVKAKYKDMSSIIKVVAIDSDDEVLPTKITADKEVTLKVGDYGDVNYKFDVEEKIAHYLYTSVRVSALDKGIVEFGQMGSFRAVKPGGTTIVSLIEIEEEMLVGLTKVTVVDPNAKPVEKKKAPKKGKKLADKKFVYKITKKASDNGKKAGEVVVVKLLNKKLTKATVKSVVEIDGYKYKVTAIGKKACKGAKKLKKVTIGKNVKKIGDKAFYNLKKLTKVTFKSSKLPKIGKKAFFKKGKKKLTIKVNKKLKKKVKKTLKKKLNKALKKAKCKGYKVK